MPTTKLVPETSDILFNLNLDCAGCTVEDWPEYDEELMESDYDNQMKRYALDRASEAKELYPITFNGYPVEQMAEDYLERI